MRRFGGFAAVFILALSNFAWGQFSTSARQAVVYDFETWQLLYTKNADQPMTPSSMTKIMTAYIIFEAIENNEITLEQRFRITRNAFRREGSTMWLRLDTRVPVDDLLNGLIVQSGNDASVALAEGLEGSVSAFVKRMNETALRLGMRNTRFVNPSGLNPDDPNDPMNQTTANDIAVLSRAMIDQFPQYYTYFSTPEFEFAGINQTNRNLLLGGPFGVDGIKTGYTAAGGYGQAVSAIDQQTGRRIVVVFNGTESKAARKREAERLIEFGLENFSNHQIFDVNQIVGYAPVWLGTDQLMPLVVKRRVRRTLRVNAINNMQGTMILYQSPLNAPVAEGQELGRLLYFSLGMSGESAPFEETIYAGKNIDKLGPLDAALEGVYHYFLSN